MGSYIVCFCGGVATLLVGMAAGVAVILFYKERMCGQPRRNPHPQRRQERFGDENAPRSTAHTGRWVG